MLGSPLRALQSCARVSSGAMLNLSSRASHAARGATVEALYSSSEIHMRASKMGSLSAAGRMHGCGARWLASGLQSRP